MSEKLERKPQKWIKEGDEFYPINGNTVLHQHLEMESLNSLKIINLMIKDWV